MARHDKVRSAQSAVYKQTVRITGRRRRRCAQRRVLIPPCARIRQGFWGPRYPSKAHDVILKAKKALLTFQLCGSSLPSSNAPACFNRPSSRLEQPQVPKPVSIHDMLIIVPSRQARQSSPVQHHPGFQRPPSTVSQASCVHPPVRRSMCPIMDILMTGSRPGRANRSLIHRS